MPCWSARVRQLTRCFRSTTLDPGRRPSHVRSRSSRIVVLQCDLQIDVEVTWRWVEIDYFWSVVSCSARGVACRGTRCEGGCTQVGPCNRVFQMTASLHDLHLLWRLLAFDAQEKKEGEEQARCVQATPKIRVVGSKLFRLAGTTSGRCHYARADHELGPEVQEGGKTKRPSLAALQTSCPAFRSRMASLSGSRGTTQKPAPAGGTVVFQAQCAGCWCRGGQYPLPYSVPAAMPALPASVGPPPHTHTHTQKSGFCTRGL